MCDSVRGKLVSSHKPIPLRATTIGIGPKELRPVAMRVSAKAVVRPASACKDGNVDSGGLMKKRIQGCLALLSVAVLAASLIAGHGTWELIVLFVIIVLAIGLEVAFWLAGHRQS